MSRSRQRRFLETTIVLFTLGLLVAFFATPPDPFTKTVTASLALLLATPLSYWLVYERDLSV